MESRRRRTYNARRKVLRDPSNEKRRMRSAPSVYLDPYGVKNRSARRSVHDETQPVHTGRS